jgi:osmotically-inducible protein OsmY
VDIATDAVGALRLLSAIPQGVQAIVHKGYITLTGSVNWLFQKRHAARAVRHVRGVRGVFNHIVVTPSVTVSDVRHRIVKALHEDANLDGRHITAHVSGSTVTLTGNVSNWLQRDTAERAAAAAPGVSHVDNQIAVLWPESNSDMDAIC